MATEIIVAIAIFLLTIVGFSIKRRLARQDERDKRRDNFVDFLRDWEAEVTAGIARYKIVAETFWTRERSCWVMATRIGDDYGWHWIRKRAFWKRVLTIHEMTGGEVSNPELDEKGEELKGVRKLLDAIQSLRVFVEHS